MKKEIRTYNAEIRASPEKPLRFEGYAAKFGEQSHWMGFIETIAPGAFTSALERGDDVRALFNHNENFVLGRTASGTCTLRQDDTGLWFEVDAPDTQWAKDLHKSVQRGDINQCSFSFYAEKEEWIDDKRTLIDLKLLDISIVTYPAYEGTTVSARSLNHTKRYNPDVCSKQLDLIEKR